MEDISYLSIVDVISTTKLDTSPEGLDSTLPYTLIQTHKQIL